MADEQYDILKGKCNIKLDNPVELYLTLYKCLYLLGVPVIDKTNLQQIGKMQYVRDNTQPAARRNFLHYSYSGLDDFIRQTNNNHIAILKDQNYHFSLKYIEQIYKMSNLYAYSTKFGKQYWWYIMTILNYLNEDVTNSMYRSMFILDNYNLIITFCNGICYKDDVDEYNKMLDKIRKNSAKFKKFVNTEIKKYTIQSERLKKEADLLIPCIFENRKNDLKYENLEKLSHFHKEFGFPVEYCTIIEQFVKQTNCDVFVDNTVQYTRHSINHIPSVVLSKTNNDYSRISYLYIFRAIRKVGKYEEDVNSGVWLYETDKYEPTIDVVVNRIQMEKIENNCYIPYKNLKQALMQWYNREI